MIRFDNIIQIVAALALLVALTGCAPTAPELTEDEQAQILCEATEYGIAKHFQPDNAEAWLKAAPELCENIREEMGRTDFILLYLDDRERDAYIAYRIENG